MSRVPYSARGFARLRERNQLTLPHGVVSKMGLTTGDLVEFVATSQGTIELRPAKIVGIGTPEAKREEEAAKEDIRQGRYSAVTGPDQFQEHLDRVRNGDYPSTSQAVPSDDDRLREVRPSTSTVSKPVADSVRPISGNRTSGSGESLSPREIDIVRHVAQGLTNREIAKLLNLTEHTVKNYLFRIFDKLGVSSRIEVVLCALGNSAPPNSAAPNTRRETRSVDTSSKPETSQEA